MSKITVSIGVRWWLKPWLWLALTINWTTGWRPSEEQLQAVVRKAIYCRVIQ